MKQGFLGTRLCSDVFVNELWRIKQQQAWKMQELTKKTETMTENKIRYLAEKQMMKKVLVVIQSWS